MLTKLSSANSFVGRYRQCVSIVYSRRFISRNIIFRNNDNKLTEQQQQQQQKQPQEHLQEQYELKIPNEQAELKTIDARVMKPTTLAPKSTAAFVELYFRRLSEKNFFLRFISNTPISIAVWMQLPKQEKIDSSIRGFGNLFLVIAIATGIYSFALYTVYHKHEFTGRGYFKINSDEIIEKYEEKVLNDIMAKYEGRFVPSSDPILQSMDRVLRKLIETNREFVEDEGFDSTWSCIMIDDDRMHDLMVNDAMKMIIFTKATARKCENEHQQAYLLAHALSHYLLKHKREPLSNLDYSNIIRGWKLTFYFRFSNALSSPSVFADVPIINKINILDEKMAKYFFDRFHRLTESINYSDTLEDETDRVALQLIARACFDVREIEKMAVRSNRIIADQAQRTDSSKEEKETNRVQHRHFYRHAFDRDHKIEYLQQIIPKFIDFRLKCGCEPLK